MKVEIWSDVVCPFCYIGKRRFEEALAKFEHKDKIEIVWKSFLLNPDIETNPHETVTEHLAKTKGWTHEYTQQMQNHVVQLAEEEGLKFDFNKAVVANSVNAHRLIQYAKENGKGNEIEELLFKAYFTEGKNIDDSSVLVDIGESVGLNKKDIHQILESGSYFDEVQKDIYESRQIGVRGVPHFVFNDRYTVSGAQAAETFLGALNKSFSEIIQL